MKEFEIENEINNAFDGFQKGFSAIQIRRIAIQKGISSDIASKISKMAYSRFLHQNAKRKIIRGSFFMFVGILGSIIFFHNGFIAYITVFGFVYGLFKVLSGILNKRAATKLSKEF